jgi:uncharacterized membrane protein
MTSSIPAPDGSAPPWRLSRLLMASLAVNFLVVGALGGTWLVSHRHGRGGRGGAGPEVGLMSFVRTLPADRQLVLRSATEQFRPAMRPLRQAARAARIDVESAIAADPFDKEKLKAAVTKLAEVEADTKRVSIPVWIRALEQMTVAERQRFAIFRKPSDRFPPGTPVPLDKNP